MSAIVVDSVAAVSRLIDDIEKSDPQPPFIFLDLEGVNLSRHGSVAIMQVLVPPARVVHLIDVHTLKELAFETKGATGTTMKTLLESDKYPKVIFDVRNDSDALHYHFQINLRCVVDLQLLEYATRSGRRRFVNGLASCISKEGGLILAEFPMFEQIKAAGQRLFAPEKGGKYEVFHERPLATAIIEYCVQDVMILPKLLLVYGRLLRNELATQVQAETLQRITLSQSKNFNGKGRHMAIGPSFSELRTANPSTVCFPLSIVCSKDLPKYCSLSISEGVGRSDENRGDVTIASDMPKVQDPPDRATGSLLEKMKSLSVKESLSVEQPLSFEGSLQKVPANDESTVGGHSGYYDFEGSTHSDKDFDKDFTACSGDDCGWCGHCDY